MKQIILMMLMATLICACGNQKADNKSSVSAKEEVEDVYTVDELHAKAAELEGREVNVKGTVMHVCKQGGGRCFLMGSNEDFNIRVEAGEKIGAFNQEQMGSDLTIRGVFRQVRTEADAHNPAREHGIDEHEHDEDAEEAHRIIVDAQEKTDVVYFMEGIEVVKEEI